MKLSLVAALLLAGCAAPVGPEATSADEETILERPDLATPGAREAVLAAGAPQEPCCCVVASAPGRPPAREACASADPARGTCVATDGRAGDWLGEACR